MTRQRITVAKAESLILEPKEVLNIIVAFNNQHNLKYEEVANVFRQIMEEDRLENDRQ